MKFIINRIKLFGIIVSMGMVFSGTVNATLIQHLDATVSNSIMNNPVTEWADQSGNANDAGTADGSVYYPSTSLSASGLPGLDFGTARNSLDLFDNR